MSQKGYIKFIEEGSKYYKKCLEAKSAKNIISHGKKAIKGFEKAIITAKKINQKDINKKLSIIYEYITQINSLIAVSYGESDNLDDSIHFLTEAIASNKKATSGNAQIERNAFLIGELAKLYSRKNNSKMALSYASQALSLGKNLKNDDLIELYVDLNPVFIKSLDIKKIESNFKAMIKLAKRSKMKKTKAEIYFDYSRYLFEVKQNYIESKKYLDKVKTLYKVLKMSEAEKIVQKYYKTKFDPEGKPIINEL